MRFTNVTERSEVTQVSPTTEQTGRCYDRFWGRESGRVRSSTRPRLAAPNSKPNRKSSHMRFTILAPRLWSTLLS